MDKRVLYEMGRRYPRISPTVIMTWTAERSGIPCLTHLNNLIDDGKMKISFIHPEIVNAVVISGRWEDDRNRQIEARFPLGIALKDDFSLNILSTGGLESIRIANQNPLNALMTRRQKVQIETAERLIKECLTPQVIVAAAEWGLTVEANLDIEIKELPGIRFSFIYNEDQTEVCNVLLDAWSGCILLNGELPPLDLPNVYTGGKQVEGILLRTIDVCVARLTA